MTLPASEETLPVLSAGLIAELKLEAEGRLPRGTVPILASQLLALIEMVNSAREQAVRECAEIADAQFRQRRDAANEYFEKGDQGSAIICRDEATACLDVGNAILDLLPTPPLIERGSK